MLRNKTLYLFPAVTLLLLLTFVMPNYYGYIIYGLFIFLAIKNIKLALSTLFIFFMFRPALTEVNPMLSYIGDITVLLTLVIVTYQNRKTLKRLIPNALEWLIFGFILVGVISSILNDVALLSIIIQVRVFGLFLAIFYVLRRIGLTKKDFNWLLYGISLGTLILAIQGYVEKEFARTILVPDYWTERSYSKTNEVRIYGMLYNPNNLGTMLLIGITSTLLVLKHLKQKWTLIIAYLIVLFEMYVLINTVSRGVFIVMGIFLFLLLLIKQHRKLGIKLLVASIVGLILLQPIEMASEKLANEIMSTDHWQSIVEGTSHTKINDTEEKAKRIKEAFSDETMNKSGQDGRVFIVKTGLRLFKEQPILGTGFGTYGDTATLLNGSPLAKENQLMNRMYSDNQYIQVLVQTGLIGCIVLAFILFLTVKQVKKKPSPLIILSLIYLTIGSLFYNSLENYTFMFLFYFLLALSFEEEHP